MATTAIFTAPVTLPRVAITFCTQCKWLLRAAWLQQELLSTFGTSIGEIALIPSTGGIFQIHLTYMPTEESRANEGASEVLIWDRKAEQGFPEAKILKQRVRNHIEPGKGLGHSDTPSSKAPKEAEGEAETKESTGSGAPASQSVAKGKDGCEDCG